MKKPIHGKVKRFDPQKRYGFITPDIRDNLGRDVHFKFKSGRVLHPADQLGGPRLVKGELRAPKANDRVVYFEAPPKAGENETCSKGKTALYWTFEDLWNSVHAAEGYCPCCRQKLSQEELSDK